MPINIIRYIVLGANHLFASNTLTILWKVGQFYCSVGHMWFVFLLHCGLPLSRIFGSQCSTQIQIIIKEYHIGMFFVVFGKNVILPPFSRWVVLLCRIFLFLPNLMNWPSFHTGHLIISLFVTKSSSTYSLRFSPSSHKDDLEDSFTTTTVGHHLSHLDISLNFL